MKPKTQTQQVKPFTTDRRKEIKKLVTSDVSQSQSHLGTRKLETAENNQENERANDNIALLSIASEGDVAKPESSRAINGDSSSPDLSSQLNPSGCGIEIYRFSCGRVKVNDKGLRCGDKTGRIIYCPMCSAKRLATAKALYNEKKKTLEFLEEKIKQRKLKTKEILILKEYLKEMFENKMAELKSEIKQIENEVPEVKDG